MPEFVPSDWLDPKEAGDLIKQARIKLQLSQEAVADAVGAGRSYYNRMENGVHHAGKSKFFAQLVQVLQISPEVAKRLNPGAVVMISEQPKRNGPPIPPVVPHRETTIEIPAELQQMIDNNSDNYPILLEPRIQRTLAAPRNFGGPDNGPQTEAEWLEYFLITRRYL